MDNINIFEHFENLSEESKEQLLRKLISVYTKHDVKLSSDSTIRLWTLGSLEYGLHPSKEAIEKLRNILKSQINDGKIDLVWGPDLTVKEI